MSYINNYQAVAAIVVCLAVSAWALYSQSPSDWNHTNIASIIKLGLIKPGQSATGKIQVNNRTSKTLRAVNVRVSCGCVVIGKLDGPIDPGGHGFLPYSISVGHAGPISHTAVISPMTEHSDVHVFRFVGIGAGLWADVQTLNLGEVGLNSGATRTAVLFAAGCKKPKIDTVTVGEECIKRTVQALPKNAAVNMPSDEFGIREGILDGSIKAWKLTVTWGSGIPKVGASSTVLTIHSIAAGVLDIPVYYAANHVNISPGKLVFSIVDPGKEIVREATIKFEQDSESIEKGLTVISDKKCVSVSFKRVKNEIRLLCRAHIDENSPGGVIEGQITGVFQNTELFKLPYIVVIGDRRQSARGESGTNRDESGTNRGTRTDYDTIGKIFRSTTARSMRIRRMSSTTTPTGHRAA